MRVCHAENDNDNGQAPYLVCFGDSAGGNAVSSGFGFFFRACALGMSSLAAVTAPASRLASVA